MKLKINGEEKARIQEGMIGLFFEDINYAADGGLYAEMLENRSFECVRAGGTAGDYWTEYDGGYAWSFYPAGAEEKSPASGPVPPAPADAQAEGGACLEGVQAKRGSCPEGVQAKGGSCPGDEQAKGASCPESARGRARCVTGSPHSEENPHYMRLETAKAGEGIQNQAYEGIYLTKGMDYKLVFWARCVKFEGAFEAFVEKDGTRYARVRIPASEGTEETYNHFRKFEAVMRAEADVEQGLFALCLSVPGTVELDFVSLMPGDAVCGIFRKDLFEMLKELKPGFLRFPGGCIVEGNTLANRYRFKETLKPVWERRNNWNRWAVHGNGVEKWQESPYSHYNQTLGLGYYEYFLLCEKLGARPLPVLNVGFACQYQSDERVDRESPAFSEFLQDALDLIEFANGDENTRWGGVRARMGHREPFGLTMLGVGNEQWQTQEADFFERYEIFEETIHRYAPEIRLIGSAGPDITSQRYEKAWEFYHRHEAQKNFVYAVDEHYYVKPQWLYDHVHFYDKYSREVKVFSGEYAAHPVSGFNMPEANTLEGALAEAAFLTGVERNADVVVLASYAPLFARLRYAQWSPDMIWFDGKACYGTPSYYVQRMYARNMGTAVLDVKGREEAEAEGIYVSASVKEGEILLKAVNSGERERHLELELPGQEGRAYEIHGEILTGRDRGACNSLENPRAVFPYETKPADSGQIVLPPLSFTVLRVRTGSRTGGGR